MSDYQHEHGKMLTNDFSISTFLIQLDLLLQPPSTIDSNLRTKIEYLLAVFEWDAIMCSAPMYVQIWIPDFDANRADAICRLL